MNHPSRRSHRFFDSTGARGRAHPRTNECSSLHESRLLEIDSSNIVQYAHYSYIYCMQLVRGLRGSAEDLETLFTGGGDGDVKLWSIDSHTSKISEKHILHGGDSGVLSMGVRETFLYCGLTDGEINIWDLDTYQLIRNVKAHQHDVLTMSVWGNSIFSGSGSGSTKVICLCSSFRSWSNLKMQRWGGSFECQARWQAHDGLVLASVAFAMNDRILYITGGNDNSITIWDISPLEHDRPPQSKSHNGKLTVSLLFFLYTLH